MRCLKCGYISFDFNQICPKCNKDISDHQDKMNIPPFRPNPPSLLGALIGETDESDLGIDISSAPEMIPEPESHAAFDESLELQEAVEIDKEQDTNIELETEAEGVSSEKPTEIPTEEDVLDFDLQTEEEEISLEPEAIAPEEPAPIESTVESEIEDSEISLDLEDLSFESEETGPAEVSTEEQEEDLSLGFDDINLDEPQEDIGLDQVKEEELAPEIDSQVLTEEEKSVTDEIELKLDDLKINETGELEVEATTESPTGETTLVDDISLDGSQLDAKKGDGEKTLVTDKTLSEAPDLDFGDMDKEAGVQDSFSEDFKEDTPIADEPLNLDDISIDDAELDLSDDSIETEDISLDESQDEEELSLDENIGLDDLTFDKSGSDEEPPPEPTLDLDLDLENLDLDLDLDNPEEK